MSNRTVSVNVFETVRPLGCELVSKVSKSFRMAESERLGHDVRNGPSGGIGQFRSRCTKRCEWKNRNMSVKVSEKIRLTELDLVSQGFEIVATLELDSVCQVVRSRTS